MISNILLRMVHIEMLYSYETKDIIDFVKSFNKKVELSDYDNIWFEEGEVSLFTHRIWIDGLSNWLASKNISLDKFLSDMITHIIKTDCIPARPILRSYLPFIPDFYSASDVRELCLSLLPKREDLLNKAKLIQGKDEKDTKTRFLVVDCKDEERFATNYMPWFNFMVKNAPIFLDLPAFEEVNLCASKNSVTTTLEHKAEADIDKNILNVNGKPIGKIVPFSECIKIHNIPWENDYEKKLECVLIERDYVDPKSGAVLLRKNCFYGAPVNISKITFKKNLTLKDPFAKLMSAIVRQEFDSWKPLQRAHEKFLGTLNDSVTVIYYKNDDSISVNEKHLMRNVPARILRNILRIYSSSGREEYENREFKRDPEICLDPLRPNFESRLHRVVDHLSTISNYFEIERHRRGGFRFVPHCKIIFKEE